MPEKQDWFKCDIDRKALKTLSRRSNYPGIAHFGTYFTILSGLGAALVYTWGSWWAVAVMLLYSALWSFANAAGHEACHGTPFKSHNLNQTLLYLCSWMLSWEPISLKWVHARHHSYTSEVGNDAEYLLPNPIRWTDILSLAAGWNQVWHYNKELVQLAFGYVNHFIKESVPASELAGVIRNARLLLLSYFAIICISIWMQTWLPVCLLLLPRAIGAPVHGILRITQHGALATGVRDHRLTTRTMNVNPILRFFYCSMNYHVEHHMFPMVPFHALKKLHEQVKDQMPAPSKGVISALAEVFVTKTRQKIDENHVFQPIFPTG